jgi:hypothetical protein
MHMGDKDVSRKIITTIHDKPNIFDIEEEWEDLYYIAKDRVL